MKASSRSDTIPPISGQAVCVLLALVVLASTALLALSYRPTLKAELMSLIASYWYLLPAIAGFAAYYAAIAVALGMYHREKTIKFEPFEERFAHANQPLWTWRELLMGSCVLGGTALLLVAAIGFFANSPH